MPVTSAPFRPLASLGRRGARGSPRLALLDGGMDALPRTTANRQPSPATPAYPHPCPNMADPPIKIPPENSLRAIFFSTLPSSFSNHSHKRPVSAPICSSPPPGTTSISTSASRPYRHPCSLPASYILLVHVLVHVFFLDTLLSLHTHAHILPLSVLLFLLRSSILSFLLSPRQIAFLILPRFRYLIVTYTPYLT